MKLEILAEVTKISREHDYDRKPNGESDWAKPVSFYETVLTVMDNKEGIRGTLLVRGKFDFGQIFRISVDMGTSLQVVESKDEIVLSHDQNTLKRWP
jgi:hypothetical protein